MNIVNLVYSQCLIKYESHSSSDLLLTILSYSYGPLASFNIFTFDPNDRFDINNHFQAGSHQLDSILRTFRAESFESPWNTASEKAGILCSICVRQIDELTGSGHERFPRL